MRCLVFACVLLAWIGFPSNLGEQEAPLAGPADEAMQRLSIRLPAGALASDSIRKPLEELSREQCDQRAITELDSALEQAGFRRPAAAALLRFSETCGGQAAMVRKAADILLALSDYHAASITASKLIEMEPFDDTGYYIRGVANDKAGFPKKAINDYITTIELFGDKTKISSAVYLALARAYERLGKFCDAAGTIEAWVAISPAQNGTSQTRSIIATYASKGGCPVALAAEEEEFPISEHNNVATVQATVNGTPGTFLVDTGATFVSLKAAFAKKAKVAIDEQSSIQLSTANGLGEAKLGRAETIKVRSLQAAGVPLVVQTRGKSPFAEGVDGLLGMSFLSRFNVTMDGRTVKLSARPLH